MTADILFYSRLIMTAPDNANKAYILWTGRFQPPHLGHIQILRAAKKVWSEPFIIGIIWSQSDPLDSGEVREDSKHHPLVNPFTLWERSEMLRIACESEGIGIRAIYLPRNTRSRTRLGPFLPPCYIRATTDKDAKDLEKAERWKAAGERVRILNLQDLSPVTATELKISARSGGAWRPFLHPATHSYFLEIGGPDRIRSALMNGDEQ